MATRKKKTTTRKRAPVLTVDAPPAPEPGADPTHEDFRAAAAILNHHGSPVAGVLETMAEEAKIDELLKELGPVSDGTSRRARETFRKLIRDRS